MLPTLKANMYEIANSSNVTNVTTNEGKCGYQLNPIGYTYMPYSYGTATGSLIVFLTSGVLNTYSIKMVSKEERYSVHSVLLLNIFVADLSLGSLLDVFMAISALKVNVCVARVVLQITLFIFTDVNLLSLVCIALNQAEQVKRLLDFAQPSNQTQGRLQMFKVAIIWLYSSIISCVDALLYPNSMIWFFQVIVMLMIILALHCYTLKKLNRVIPSNDSVLLQRKIQVIRKAQKLIVALAMAEVLTWVPLILACVLYLLKVIKSYQIDETLFWTINITYLAPLFNPIVLFVIRNVECKRQVSANVVDILEMNQEQ